MKVLKPLIALIFSLIFSPKHMQAQFLKKLGKTVKEVANKTLTDDNSKNKTSTNDRTTTQPVAVLDSKTTNSQESSFDFAKHNISVLNAGSASFIKGEYFIESYSFVQVKDNQIIPTVVVGKMTEAERLSELGEGSEKDVAFIYENGGKKEETTVGKLDKNLNTYNKKYDWYMVKDVAKDGANKYVKPDKNGVNYNISFNGKTYGPYLMVSDMIIDKTGTRFFATVSLSMKGLENQKVYLLSNDGKLKPIGFGGELLANINFTKGCTIIPPVTALVTKIAKEENEAKQEALQKQMTDLMMNHQNESDVEFFNGKKLTNILAASPWLDQSGNNIFSIQVDATNNFARGLYLNGKNIADAMPTIGQAWSNEDGSNWAYVSYDGAKSLSHLIFKDGTDVTSKFHPRQVAVGDKTFMVWFMYNRANSDEILTCYKEL